MFRGAIGKWLLHDDRNELFEILVAAALNVAFLALAALVLWLLDKPALALHLAQGYGLLWVAAFVSIVLLQWIHRMFRVDLYRRGNAYLLSNLAVSCSLQAGWAAFAALAVRGFLAGTPAWIVVLLYLVTALSCVVAYFAVSSFYQGHLYKLVSLPFALASFLAFSIWSVGTAHAQPAQKMATYSNASWRWSISYPAGWKVDTNYPGLVEIRSPADNALCSIHSGPMDRFNTVDELTDFMLRNDEDFLRGKGQKFAVLARQRIRLPNGIVGNDVLAEIGPGGRSRRVHVLVDGRGFAIDCEAYTKAWDKLEGAYQRIISSFTVRK